jgi:UDP:flavonoid glycosyltransferase YjiC (YdhE family)
MVSGRETVGGRRDVNVIVAWELGAGLGHVGRHLELAQLLRSRGVEVTFVVKDLQLANNLLGRAGFTCVQAPTVPRFQAPQGDGGGFLSYSDILAYLGMSDAALCRQLLDAWIRILDVCKTQLVLIDHAPAALFAAKCRGLKTISLDVGFTRPPLQTPFPCFRPWEGVGSAELLAREEACLAVLNDYSRRYGMASFSTLAEAVNPDLPLITSFYELDHYPQREGGKYIGPTHSFSDGVSAKWRGDRQRRIFVYLRGLPGLVDVLGKLIALEAELVVYSPQLDAAQCRQLTSAHCTVSSSPVCVRDVLPDCDLVISNGGHGLMSACLLFAVNSVVIPLYMEQRLMADCLRRAGVGLGVPPDRADLDLMPALESILGDARYRVAAESLRQKYRSYDFPSTLNRLANTVTGLVSSEKM